MTDQAKPPSRIGPKIAVNRDLPFHESLVHMLWHAVESKPENVAVIYQDRSITYRDFGRACNGLAALLNSVASEPGPIVIMMPNSIEMDVALMAVMSTGVQVAPLVLPSGEGRSFQTITQHKLTFIRVFFSLSNIKALKN